MPWLPPFIFHHHALLLILPYLTILLHWSISAHTWSCTSNASPPFEEEGEDGGNWEENVDPSTQRHPTMMMCHNNEPKNDHPMPQSMSLMDISTSGKSENSKWNIIGNGNGNDNDDHGSGNDGSGNDCAPSTVGCVHLGMHDQGWRGLFIISTWQWSFACTEKALEGKGKVLMTIVDENDDHDMNWLRPWFFVLFVLVCVSCV